MRQQRDSRETAERQQRDSRETAERQQRDRSETAERQQRDSSETAETAERQQRDGRETAKRRQRDKSETALSEITVRQQRDGSETAVSETRVRHACAFSQKPRPRCVFQSSGRHAIRPLYSAFRQSLEPRPWLGQCVSVSVTSLLLAGIYSDNNNTDNNRINITTVPLRGVATCGDRCKEI